MTPTCFTYGVADGRVPFLGHLGSLVANPLRFLESLPKYGDFTEIRLGPHRTYVPCHPELARHLIAGDRVFDKGGPLFDKGREIFGNGLATCGFRDHRRQRRYTQPAFDRHHIERYSRVMAEETAALASRWRDGTTVNAYAEFYGMAMRITVRALFSHTVADGDIATLRSAYATVSRGAYTHMFKPRILRKLHTPGNRRFHQSVATLRATAARLHEKSHAESDDNLLSLLIAGGTEPDAALGETEIRDQTVSFIAGGAETTAAALAWAVLLVSRNPRAAARLREEMHGLGHYPAGYADLPRLAHTGRIVTEALRMYPPLWFLTRTVTEPTRVAGHRVPAGSVVIYSPYLLHRRPDFYPDPHVFRPDRWLPENSGHLPRSAFNPFGYGARQCIGNDFARTEATLALANVLGRWTLTPTPQADLRPTHFAAFLRPRRLLMRLRRI